MKRVHSEFEFKIYILQRLEIKANYFAIHPTHRARQHPPGYILGPSLLAKLFYSKEEISKQSKFLTFSDVCYVPKVRRNLLSSSLMNKVGSTQIFKRDRYVLNKDGVFVEIGYMFDGMFKLQTDY